MEYAKKMMCDCCKRLVNISDIRYLPKGNDSWIILCSTCRARNITTEKKVFPDIKSAVQKIAPATKEKTNIHLPKTQLYYCSKCKYKFKFISHDTNSMKCPYCGKADKIVEYNSLLANNLIRSSTDEFY